jgi:hypothetical protein
MLATILLVARRFRILVNITRSLRACILLKRWPEHAGVCELLPKASSAWLLLAWPGVPISPGQALHADWKEVPWPPSCSLREIALLLRVLPTNFRESPKGEVRRIPIPRTRVNKKALTSL